MINFGPNFELSIPISNSRLDSFCHCSAKFLANYFYKIPDKGNSGSGRGSVCHDFFELLATKKRKNLIPNIISANSVRSFKSLWKLIGLYAKKYNVCNETDLNLIDSFIVTGLITDSEPEGTVEVLIEKEFNFEVIDKERGIRYRLRGFIDKTYIIERQGVKYILCRDFKGSKQKFDKKKMSPNTQSLIYQLAFRYLFPEYQLLSFDFIFLKFRDNPIQTSGVYPKHLLDGFEHYLTDIQSQLERFSYENANDNIAYLDYSKKALCGTGQEGFKPDGSPIWICPARKPMWYWVELDDKGEIKKSYFENEKPEGVKVEKRFYSGCSFFFSKEGKPQQLSFQ
jgi:hypothetical protein